MTKACKDCSATVKRGYLYCEACLKAAKKAARARARADNPYAPPAIRERRDRTIAHDPRDISATHEDDYSEESRP